MVLTYFQHVIVCRISPPVVFNWATPLPLDIVNSSMVTAMVRSSASGAWLVAGDFGLRVNE